MDTARFQAILARFAADRDWDQFHSPKNLSTALVCEAAELAEIFQWMTAEQSAAAMDDAELAKAIRDELADVQLYLLRIADKLSIDLQEAMLDKIERNAEKYPVELARGNAEKYSRRKG
jgi:NTP pyrophosphatase (non-canonical NTP hydrolase)